MTSKNARRDGVLDPSREPDLAELLRVVIRAAKLGVRVAIPAKVVTFDATLGTAKVVTEILGVQVNAQGVDEPQTPLLIDRVPVSFLNNGVGGYVTVPIVPGTTGQLVVNDRGIGTWLQQGVAAEPPTKQTHSLNDATFYPGMVPGTNPITPPVDLTATVVEGAALVKSGRGAVDFAVKGTALAAVAATLDAVLVAVPPSTDPIASVNTAIAANKAAISGLLSAIQSNLATKAQVE